MKNKDYILGTIKGLEIAMRDVQKIKHVITTPLIDAPILKVVEEFLAISIRVQKEKLEGVNNDL